MEMSGLPGSCQRPCATFTHTLGLTMTGSSSCRMTHMYRPPDWQLLLATLASTKTCTWAVQKNSLAQESRPGTATGALATCCHGVSCCVCGHIWMAAEGTSSVRGPMNGLAAASSTLWASAVSHSTR